MIDDIQQVKDLYARKIQLFNSLLKCVTLERESLINLDIKDLWELMDKKEEIMEDITHTRDELKDLTGGENIYHDIPPEERRQIRELSQTLTALKLKTTSIVRENVSFINESLDFLHDMFSVITNASIPKDSYGPIGKKMMPYSNQIYYNEV